MKLIVQIPCLNEEETLAATIRDIPREIPGVDCVEIVVVDDGSTDETSRIAQESGADAVIRFPRNRGLGWAFKAGMEAALERGADIIVNTDGDNQYFGGDIPRLIEPILEGRADLVVGDRQAEQIEHFSRLKKFLQKVGSRVVSRLAHLQVPDVASGFRAFNRRAALQLSTFTGFDHTAEHIVEAGQKRLAVVSVPIRTNPKFRESRLFNHVATFVWRSGLISLRTYSQYKALKIFSFFGILTFSAGFLIGLRFLYFFLFTDEGDIHIQSVILAAVLLLAGFQMVLTGIGADLIAINRMLLEEALERLRKIELESGKEGPPDQS